MIRRYRFKSDRELKETLVEENINLKVSSDDNKLLQPLMVAGHRIPNRFVSLPMEGCDALQNGAPGPKTIRKYERIAKGGYGLIWLEATSVNEKGKSNDAQLMITEDNLDEFKALIDRIKTAGKDSEFQTEPVTILQLNHSGRYSNKNKAQAAVITSHKKPLDEKRSIPDDYQLISDEELRALKNDYLKSARLAKLAGFDGVDIKACHGYLLGELLSSFDRPGEYGGALRNRTRLMIEILRDVSEDQACKGLILASRLNITDYLEYPYGWGMSKDGTLSVDLAEPKELIQNLVKSGLNLLGVTLGNPYFIPHINKVSDLKSEDDLESPLVSCARLINLTGEIQAEFPDLAVVNVGQTWFRDLGLNIGAGALEDGKASLLGFGRQGIAYPDLPNDLKKVGAAQINKTCTTCNKCSELKANFYEAGCVIRDSEVYLPIYREYLEKVVGK